MAKLKKNPSQQLKGFSLVETLIVVATCAILIAAIIIATNPMKNFRDARNSQRSYDVAQILNAVNQYTSEKGHSLADFGNIPSCATTASAIGTEGINFEKLLVPDYIITIPTDPSDGTTDDTGYTVCTTGAGRIQVTAPNAESKTIVVRR